MYYDGDKSDTETFLIGTREQGVNGGDLEVYSPAHRWRRCRDAKVGDTPHLHRSSTATPSRSRWSARSPTTLAALTVSLLLCRLPRQHRRLDQLNRLASSAAFRGGGIVDSTSSNRASPPRRLRGGIVDSTSSPGRPNRRAPLEIADQIGDVLGCPPTDEPDRPAPRAASPLSTRASSHRGARQ